MAEYGLDFFVDGAPERATYTITPSNFAIEGVQLRIEQTALITEMQLKIFSQTFFIEAPAGMTEAMLQISGSAASVDGSIKIDPVVGAKITITLYDGDDDVGVYTIPPHATAGTFHFPLSK